MAKGFEGTVEQQRDRVQGLGREAANTAAEMKDRVQAFGRDAANAASDMKDRVQETMSDVTDAVRERAGQVSDSVSNAAAYVTESEPQDIWDDITSTIKARPFESLAAAAVIGFFVGRAARRM